jgi:hypothetical protein
VWTLKFRSSLLERPHEQPGGEPVLPSLKSSALLNTAERKFSYALAKTHNSSQKPTAGTTVKGSLILPTS